MLVIAGDYQARPDGASGGKNEKITGTESLRERTTQLECDL